MLQTRLQFLYLPSLLLHQMVLSCNHMHNVERVNAVQLRIFCNLMAHCNIIHHTRMLVFAKLKLKLLILELFLSVAFVLFLNHLSASI